MVRGSLGWAAALLLACLIGTAALAASERTERPSSELSLTVLLKGNPGGR